MTPPLVAMEAFLEDKETAADERVVTLSFISGKTEVGS